jgi:hypothetical protein
MLVFTTMVMLKKHIYKVMILFCVFFYYSYVTFILNRRFLLLIVVCKNRCSVYSTSCEKVVKKSVRNPWPDWPTCQIAHDHISTVFFYSHALYIN